jgi:hypothetical protein
VFRSAPKHLRSATCSLSNSCPSHTKMMSNEWSHARAAQINPDPCRTGAPSGDNTQPWSFAWDGETLSVLFTPEKTRHVLDAGLSAARIALGCLLGIVETDAAHLGFTLAQVHHRADQTRRNPMTERQGLPSRRRRGAFCYVRRHTTSISYHFQRRLRWAVLR